MKGTEENNFEGVIHLTLQKNPIIFYNEKRKQKKMKLWLGLVKKKQEAKKTSFQSSFPHASMPNNAPRFFTTQRINWGKMSITGKWHLSMVKRKQQNFIQT